MANYDPKSTQELAEKFGARAERTIYQCSMTGFFIGAGILTFPSFSSRGLVPVDMILIGGITGLACGFLVGRNRVLDLRFREKTLLALIKIAEATRGT